MSAVNILIKETFRYFSSSNNMLPYIVNLGNIGDTCVSSKINVSGNCFLVLPGLL